MHSATKTKESFFKKQTVYKTWGKPEMEAVMSGSTKRIQESQKTLSDVIEVVREGRAAVKQIDSNRSLRRTYGEPY